MLTFVNSFKAGPRAANGWAASRLPCDAVPAVTEPIDGNFAWAGGFS